MMATPIVIPLEYHQSGNEEVHHINSWLSKTVNQHSREHNILDGVATIFALDPDFSLTLCFANVAATNTLKQKLEVFQQTLHSALKYMIGDKKIGHAFIKASLLGRSCSIPFCKFELINHAEQGIYLINLNSVYRRVLMLTLILSPAIESQAVILTEKQAESCILLRDENFLPQQRKRQCPAGAIAHTFVTHPNFFFSINENADYSARKDISLSYRHLLHMQWLHPFQSEGCYTEQYLQGMLTCMNSMLLDSSVAFPLTAKNTLNRGIWQGAYLFDISALSQETFEQKVSFSSHTSPFIHKNILLAQGNSSMNVQKILSLPSKKRGCTLITDAVVQTLESAISRCKMGVLHCFLQHTSASILLNDASHAKEMEIALQDALDLIVPESWFYQYFTHTLEGPDDMTGHVKSSLLGVSLFIPVMDGKLLLRTLGIYLCEHRRRSSGSRQVVLTLQGMHF